MEFLFDIWREEGFVANKFNGVRSALAINSDQIYLSRHDDDVNVLSLAADFIDDKEAKKLSVFYRLLFPAKKVIIDASKKLNK